MAEHVRFLTPDTLAPPPGYSYVVESTAPARIFYFAGQLGLDLDNRLVGPDFHSQATRAFENLKAALAAVGATFDDVVKINNYLTDMGDIASFREVRDRFFRRDPKPASTTVGVTALARPGAVFEIEAVAVLPATAAPARRSATVRKAAARSKAKAKGKPKRKAPAKARKRRSR